MKKRKLTWMLALITALMATACSNDENMPGSGGNDNGVITFTVTPDYGVKTRAGLDALPAGKALRCIMEVYDTSGAFVSREVKHITNQSDPIEFTVEKKSENKTVVFWADFTTTGSPDADLYYKTDANSTYGLKAITFNPSNTTDFNGEAFYGNITLENGATAETSITLTHAVAMVNLKTTTQLKDLKSVKVTYGDTGGNTNAPASAFNASDGTCTSAETVIQINKTIDATQTPNESAPYDFNTFYVFAPGTDKTLINITMEMCSDDNGTTPMQTINVPNVPIRANYKTNITGDFAVQPNSFNITCEAGWATGELAPFEIIWDGKIPAANGSYTFSGGTGEKADPYVIADSKDLAQLAANTNDESIDYDGKYFELANDLDLNNKEWTPISSNLAADKYGINFDGKGHKITGLNVNGDYSLYNAGLFGHCKSIKNLHVQGSVSSMAESGNVGGIVGQIKIDGTDTPTIASNCSFEGSVKGYNVIGGLIGCTSGNYSRIEGCKNSATVQLRIGPPSTRAVGGLIGKASSIYVESCYNTGIITNDKGGDSSDATVGGLVGAGVSEDTPCGIHNCYNIGSITEYEKAAAVGSLTGDKGVSKANNCFVKEYYKNENKEQTKIFANGTWPTWSAGGSADGTDENGYWKSVGSWDATNPVYPALWWE